MYADAKCACNETDWGYVTFGKRSWYGVRLASQEAAGSKDCTNFQRVFIYQKLG